MSNREASRRHRASWGYVLRTYIHKVTLTLHPYLKVVVPNFRRAHYVYIISMSFLVAIICYPLSNFKFIDILFLLSGSCTQAGLNTVNLNDLRLLQQIIIYIATTLTTPIFIHSSLLFIRLYWFERYFDNIKETSKLNFKMRRNATLAARTRSVDSTQLNTYNNQGLGFSNTATSNVDPLTTKNALEVNPAPRSPSLITPNLGLLEKEYGTTLYSEPSDDDKAPEVVPPEERVVTDTQNQSGIKFGDLPQPSAARRQDIEPSEMFKSIAMLQNKRRESTADDDVLVIKPPNEIEKEKNAPIYTMKNLRAHMPTSPRRSRMWRKSISKKGWASLKKSLSNTAPQIVIRRYSTSASVNEADSIDSEEGRRPKSPRISTKTQVDTAGYDADDNEDNDEDRDVEDEDVDDLSDGASIRSLYSDEEAIENESMDSERDLASLNDDIAGGQDRKTKFALDPKIDRQPNRPKRRRRSSLRKWRTPMARMSSTLDILPNNSDDEEHYFSEGANSLDRTMSTNYLSWKPTIGRNSTFVLLNDTQKEELGGVEYRAIKLLIKILVLYYVGFHIIAFCFFVGFINVAKGYGSEMRAFGFLPTWWGFFTAQSVFNDLGLTLTPNSMVPFSRSVYVLVVASFFIVIGNTGFPIFLRFIIWIMFKFAKPLSLFKESLGFLLDHPRRCFTLLFPSVPTWWLFFILVVLNVTDLVLFIVLDLHNPYLSSIPTGFRILDGLFQAFSTRTAGFSVVDLSELHPAVQVSYMIMMYISVLPLAISIRRTNVYEEQSLGIYAQEEAGNEEESPTSFVGTHLRNQLSFDLWFIFLGLFIICIAEGNKLDNSNILFTVFTVMFEIISAYGTVGLSLGYPNINQSFSFEFTTVSKLVIIAMMIRGRHRGLPYTLDRAIMLPDADMKRRDAMQEYHALQRGHTLDLTPTGSPFVDAGSSRGGLFEGLKKTITKTASAYRKNSLFPTPTRLPHEMRRPSEDLRRSTNEMHEMQELPIHVRRSMASGDVTYEPNRDTL